MFGTYDPLGADVHCAASVVEEKVPFTQVKQAPSLALYVPGWHVGVLAGAALGFVSPTPIRSTAKITNPPAKSFFIFK